LQKQNFVKTISKREKECKKVVHNLCKKCAKKVKKVSTCILHPWDCKSIILKFLKNIFDKIVKFYKNYKNCAKFVSFTKQHMKLQKSAKSAQKKRKKCPPRNSARRFLIHDFAKVDVTFSKLCTPARL